MFITKPLTPLEMLAELLQKRPVALGETKAFQSLRHNKHLCRAFRNKGRSILEVYKAYRADCQDIQGRGDQGVDVLLRYQIEIDGVEKRQLVGLQLKSYAEFAKYKSGKDPDFISRIKNQYAAATQSVRVDHLYLVLCTDAILHEDQIRTITSELKGWDGLTIITPEQALSFYQMSETDIETSVIRSLCGNDPVLVEAKRFFRDMSDFESYALIHILCNVHAGEKVMTPSAFTDLHDRWNEIDGFGSDDLGTVIESFENAGYLVYTGQNYAIIAEEMPTILSAIYFDIRTRRDIPSDVAADYLWQLLGLGE
ncbi:hypothetical protein [Rhizobium sp. C1]|jgi:hypothetical protein|uniref:hypothetical protein n=1 Tax=Rhizobium sp. C1 TaxID=1349799 RepID=UPI001E404599|nr:hypothetical protein [Rhizobium sp. C1]MCD2180303.1 hypothetical protein [Rhizobium sp. C1]